MCFEVLESHASDYLHRFPFFIFGLTGVVVAHSGVDIALYDTFYIVAHFHYISIMGAAFTILEAFCFWIGISKSTRNNVALYLQN